MGTLARTEQDLVLDKIIADVLTERELADIRAEWGAPYPKRFVLVDNKHFGLRWPSLYKPWIPGFRYEFGVEGRPLSEIPLLGLRLDCYELNRERVDPIDGNVVVSFLNAGGLGSKSVESLGVSLHYIARQTRNEWTVELVRVEHP